MRANGSRERAPDDRLREAIQKPLEKVWIASELALLAMTVKSVFEPKVIALWGHPIQID